MGSRLPAAAVGAWLLVAVYYFYQYALRSAPSVMMLQLTEAFGVNALGVSAIVSMFYYGYSPFSLVAGAALDRFGARRVVPIGAALVGVGALLFGTGNVAAANVGRFLQGAGGVFALVGAVYLITRNFPTSLAASFIGATQMFGMAAGSAGQFVVGPIINSGLPWGQFWIYAGVAGLAIAAPPELGGSATGVINFINFTFSALLGPVFGSRLVEVPEDDAQALAHYQAGFQPLLYGIALAMILTCFLKETGPAVRRTAVEPLPANAS